jgi:hypothetical protein
LLQTSYDGVSPLQLDRQLPSAADQNVFHRVKEQPERGIMSQSHISFGTSRGPGFVTGIFGLLIGAMIVAVAFGIIQIAPSAIQVPRAVLAIFGFVFCIAGVWSILQRALSNRGQDTLSVRWMNFSFAMLILLAISGICLWIGFGPGQRLFVQNLSSTMRPVTRPVDATTGRIFFGAFGVLMSLLTVWLALTQVRKLLGRDAEEEPEAKP